MRSILAQALLVGICLGASTQADAQCRSFAKNKCIPQLAPYKFNESFNAAQLAPGDEAEVNLTFYSGQEYRVLVCPHPVLGEVNWKITDASNKIVFESFATEPKSTFDLKMASTEQLKLSIWVPESTSQMVHVGCVAILVGFKE